MSNVLWNWPNYYDYFGIGVGADARQLHTSQQVLKPRFS